MEVREQLIKKLKEEHCFWSYEQSSINEIDDDMLIEKVLIYLDLPEIKQLFEIFPKKKIKKVWINNLIPQGDYLRTLNRFFAWYYFDIKRPDSYLKSMETRHLNSLCNPKD